MARIETNSVGIKRWLYLFLGTAITVILLSWALKDVSWGAVIKALQQARWEWLVLGWLSYLASYWVRARRWGTLLAFSFSPGRFRSRLKATFIGFGASSVLPAYVGEFIRSAVLGRLDRVPFEAAVGTLFVERLLDVGVVFVLLLLPIWLGVLPNNSVLESLPLGWIGAAIVVSWGFFVVGASFPEQIAKFLGQSLSFVGLGSFQPKLEAQTLAFLAGLGALQQPKHSFKVILETLVIWLLNGFTYWAGLIAFGILKPGLLGALFTQSLTALAIALPSTPGYIGPFEAGIRLSLGVYQLPIHLIVAYAVAMRFLMYVTIPIIAGAIVLKTGLSASELTSKRLSQNVDIVP
jgi:hypothetical protein